MTDAMTLTLERPDAHRLVAHLREGTVTTEVTGWRPEHAAAQLLDAVERAETDGYGEAFWFEPTGQYWWLFRREENRLEVAVLFCQSAVSWQHVFRATDGFEYVIDLVRAECARVCPVGP